MKKRLNLPEKSGSFFVYFSDAADLKDPEAFRSIWEEMPPYRKEKIRTLRLEKDRQLSLCAGRLLSAAMRDNGLDPEEEIMFGPHGKPYLKDYSGVFQFSLSHAGTMAMGVFSVSECGNAAEVGCDIEKIRSVSEKIAGRCFTPAEQAYLDSIQEKEEKKKAFFRLWTRKESLLKCIGSGFSGEFRTDLSAAEKKQFCFAEGETEEYVYSVCIRFSSGA